MNFDIPDWGGGDSFIYYTDASVSLETFSKISGNEPGKGKKRRKKNGDQDIKDSHTALKKRKIDVTHNSIKQNDVELSANQTKPLSSPKKKNKKKTRQDVNSEGRELKNEATKSSIKQNDVGLNVNQTKPLTSPKRSPEKKGKEKEMHLTKDSKGIELKSEGTNSVGYVDDVLSPKTSTNKKKKKKSCNKYKQLNIEQKRIKAAQGNTLLGAQDGSGESVSGNVNAVMKCELNSEILVGTASVLQQKGKKSKVCDKDKHQKRKKMRVQLKNSQVNCPEKCTVQSKNASEQYDTTETDKGMDVLTSETEGLNTKKTDEKHSNKSKVVNKKIVAENEMCSESKVNKNIGNKKNILDMPKSRVMKKTFEKGKKTVNVNDEKQSKQLTDKKQKKAKRDDEITEELLFDDDEELDPKFQSDFKTLLKDLNFGGFHSPEPKKDSSKEPASSVQNKNEDGPLYAKIKDGEKILEIEEETGFENLKNDGNTFNKKLEGKTTDEQKYEMKIDPCVKSVPKINEKRKFDKSKLARMLDETDTATQIKPTENSIETLKQRMMNRLAVARFRMVNEELYKSSSTDSSNVFKDNSEAFAVYHAGYQAQVERWPISPLDLIVKWLSTKSREWVVADFGCGEAALSLRVPQKKVYSLDLVAANSKVIACNMAHSPLQSASVDVVVFCLSLMSSNIKDFIMEANRVLREGGIMKIAEVESRFGDIKQFVSLLGKYGFHCTHKNTSQTYFFIFEFKKYRKLKKTIGLPEIILKPCIYKKR